ncbi:hypothetical protein [Anaerotignum propionicum]|uniref:hypothetical protein n=1 Tax=Anaerotignum propionicum TaxID=28446 RepID=UPI00210B88E2|nr:hypothetical protein [Anaerotignum propionicum]MCQ4936302.1 hypothetical protein [Anaerotignum propionicum]
MILNKEGFKFKIFEVESESELIVVCNEKQSAILGLDSESKMKFYFIEFQQQNSERFFGLVNGGHGIEPTVAKIETKGLAIISSDKSVYLVDLNDLHIITQVICESLVYDVLLIQGNSSQILIICELEVRCLSLAGSQIWRYDCDIISEFKLYENHLEIFTDDDNVKISLEDGSLL